ncbi:hypothetical protein ACJJTC_011747 [Scirpophaga incertulas]
MIVEKVPVRAWQKVGVDLFKYSNCCPNELVFNRKVKEILPMYPNQLNIKTKSQKHFKEIRSEFRNKMANSYNRRHKTLKLNDLQIGDYVWVIDLRKYGVIVRKAKEPRSYFIKIQGFTYRRNTWHLIPAPFYHNNANLKSSKVSPQFEDDCTEIEKNIYIKEIANKVESDLSDCIEEELDMKAQLNSKNVLNRRNSGNNESITNRHFEDNHIVQEEVLKPRVRTRPKYLNDYYCDI